MRTCESLEIRTVTSSWSSSSVAGRGLLLAVSVAGVFVEERAAVASAAASSFLEGSRALAASAGLGLLSGLAGDDLAACASKVVYGDSCSLIVDVGFRRLISLQKKGL